MANIITLGSLYLDGCPVEIGTKYNPGQAIELGETALGKEINWIVANSMLIADRCILINVSWNDLHANSLIFGKEVAIGGYHYQARLLKVGTKRRDPNEWDAALDLVGEDNELWHWENTFFWGQERPTDYQASDRASRGYDSARYWNWSGSSYRYADLGFRPALVPLVTEDISPTLLGHRVMLWGGQSIVFGRMEDVSAYDVVISNGDGALSHDFGTRLYDGRIVVDRSAVDGMQNI